METKQNTMAMGAIGLAITAIVVTLFMGGQDISINPNPDNNTITVRGESGRLVAPDTARVSFSMTRKNTDLSQATDSVNERVGEMIDQLSDYGVEDKDMKTTSYNIQPEYNYERDSGERIFDGYRVTQSIELIIRDLDEVAPIMTQVAQFEVDNVSGLSFYVDEDEEIRDELRAEAIEDAQKKARELSRDLGVDLSTIIGFNEGSNNNYPVPMYERALGMGGMEDAAAKAVLPTGENNYTSNVSITYRIDN